MSFVEKPISTSWPNILTRKECAFIWSQLYNDREIKPEFDDFVIKPDLKSVGFLGQYFDLVLIGNDDTKCELKKRETNGNSNNYEIKTEPESHLKKTVVRLFMKTLPFANKELSGYIQNAGILKKEATLYATLLKDLKRYSARMWSPKCFYIREDDLIVMEHLAELDYKPNSSKMDNLQSNEIKDLLKCLADMHASSIVFEVKSFGSIGERYKEVQKEITVSSTEPFFITGLKTILDIAKKHPLYQEHQSQAFIDSGLKQALDAVYEMVNESKKYRNVFCHRDPWAGNVLFHTNCPKTSQITKRSTMLVDFQTCRYCPPAIDLLLALYMNLTRIERKSKEEKFIKFYYESIEEALDEFHIKVGDEISWMELLSSYEEFRLFGALYKAIAITVLDLPNDYLSNMKLQSPEKYYEYVYVDRTSDVLRLMEKFADFRLEINEAVVEIMTILGK